MRASFNKSTIRVSKVDYKPTFKQSTKRPLMRRLTPLAWMLIVLGALAVIAAVSIVVTNLLNANNGTELLVDRFGKPSAAHTTAQTQADVTSASQSVVANPAKAAPKVAVAATVAAAPTVAPSPAPTAVPTSVPTAMPTVAAPPANAAPWAAALAKQPDGTFLAPAAVVQQAVADVRSWYMAARTDDVKDYISQRDAVLADHFSGPALDTQREQAASSKEVAINRAGQLSLEVKNFSLDGYSANVGVITRGWVSDLYNAKNGKLIKAGVSQPDQLTVLTIRFDDASNRWKIISIDGTTPLQ